MLNIILVNAHNYLGRGDEYVAKLKQGITRNLTVNHTFYVLTEQDLPEGATGWWNKLFLFQPGRFTGRCLFFDLDTVITGNIDDIAAYDGTFAMVDDWFHPQLATSSVMAWEAGKADQIYTSWEAAGKPQFHPRGDGGWIEQILPHADRFQKLFPGQFVSFKASCGNGVPEGTRVVAFHGLPRPHHLSDLMNHW